MLVRFVAIALLACAGVGGQVPGQSDLEPGQRPMIMVDDLTYVVQAVTLGEGDSLIFTLIDPNNFTTGRLTVPFGDCIAMWYWDPGTLEQYTFHGHAVILYRPPSSSFYVMPEIVHESPWLRQLRLTLKPSAQSKS